MSVQVSCPACGAAVIFKIGSSMVSVCAYCRSVVARGDRSVENLGKVAELAETESPLELNMTGKYEGKRFTLTGRAQLKHEAGGLWDEWYASFPNDEWGWLAEAQGRFYLTFEEEVPENAEIPDFDELEVGATINLNPDWGPLVVAEIGEATGQGAAGEIPYRLEPGQTYRYADLSGPKGAFATLAYGDEEGPLVYFGREVTLDDLGVPATAKSRQREARQVEGKSLSCPQCGGGLELRAPDRSERIGCPNCGALLDCKEGELKFLKALEPGKVTLAFPLGSKGIVDGIDWMVIGLIVRYVVYEGTTYYWEEYLLYHSRHGFRWLVCSDRHWNFVEPVAPGAVTVRSGRAHYNDKTFKQYLKADASVAYVVGECYWKVEVGETVRIADYICPPEMLSKEVATVGKGTEVNWSLGKYMTPGEVEQAFGIKDLSWPSTVGPNQPFPFKGIYFWWGIVAGLVFILGGLFQASTVPQKVYEESFILKPSTGADKSETFFSEKPIEIKGGKNIHVRAESMVDNSWVFVEGDLINEDSGLVQSFDMPLEYYHGVDGGESWSEGNRDAGTYLSALPEGSYTLRLEVQRDPNMAKQVATLKVRIDQGVPRLLYWFLAFLAVSIIPLCVLGYHMIFDMRRWSDSDFSPYQSSDSD